MKIIKDIYQGAGYLEGYGEHPGTVILLLLIAIGGIGGADRGGLPGFFFGSVAMAIFMGPLWIIGCIGRARDFQSRNQKKEGCSNER